MLEDFKSGQPVVYKLLKKIIDKKDKTHAYLIQTNNYSYSKELVISFAKSLFCPNHYIDKQNCDDCNICHRIDQNNFSELQIIEPDGLWIKKEQLISLQRNFSKKAIEMNKRIYIIYEAEKMNVSAANSMLKFLEEPDDNIIAILVTNDIYKMLKTIVSRCQMIILKPDKLEESAKKYKEIDNLTLLKMGLINFKNDNELKDFINNKKNVDKIEAVINFVNKYEKDKLNVLLDSKNLWHKYFEEKEDQILAFEIMSFIYKDVVNYLCKRKIEIFDYYLDDIKNIANNNTVNDIIKKLNKVLVALEKIKSNVNTGLLLDKLIISIESE